MDKTPTYSNDLMALQVSSPAHLAQVQGLQFLRWKRERRGLTPAFERRVEISWKHHGGKLQGSSR